MAEQSSCSARDARAVTVTTGEHTVGKNGKPDVLISDDRKHLPKVDVKAYRCAGCDKRFRDLRMFNNHLKVK